MNPVRGGQPAVIGWYVHHQGAGHTTRFAAVAARMREHAPGVRLVGLGSRRPELWDGPWIDLPRDDVPEPVDADVYAGGALHWAPLMHPGMRERSVRVANWFHESGCQLFVVDVSVEMLLLGRLCAVPTVAMAMRGRRDDAPHTLGYDVASSIIAPWPRETQEPLPERWGRKLVATGSFSRYDQLIDDAPPARPADGRRDVVLVVGHGGDAIAFDDVAAAVRATPDWRWSLLGSAAEEWRAALPPGVVFAGSTPDVWPLLRRAHVVVGPCGAGTVGEVAAARRPYIALPQERPLDEQVAEALVLERHGLARVASSWPEAAAWPDTLDSAAALDGQRWRWYNDGLGTVRVCELLVKCVEESQRTWNRHGGTFRS